ncbi:PREDICTED: pancreatic triacylglycerol lipase-like [Cyphomyrmex costatus]|uniref:phospholipase A1 n=1 Tax=Cyphomyrmex costatus TaxID=456900 RepID=A0A195CR27_9HYME|nr:PREDICTED: pancreatic triacylglycerol lipase-like [Cyphomyrmex costatus]KYN03156.1 Pancreatic triacylglycerol lipase [Cyphomyrmex costatus]
MLRSTLSRDMSQVQLLVLSTFLLAWSAYAYPEGTLLINDNARASIVETVLEREPATFKLYTRENPFGEEQLFLNNTEVLYASHFNESRPTKFIVHGFSDTGNEGWIRDLIDAYLLYQDVNVIVVGWGILASDAYPVAAKNTRLVGEYLGQFLDFLNRDSNLEYKDVHISGHSLGSYVAGFAGAYHDGRIGRITGLDPASPLFETISGVVDPEYRLDPTDAQFVDVIHTSGPVFGFLAPLGHADFYPNNGKIPQPGCSFVPTITYCSHSRAHQLMTESIGSTVGFKAKMCESWEKYKERLCDYNPVVMMGEYASTSLRGKFYLSTNDSPPFALQ